MEQSEVEKLIGELETILDRLRALYEQYFVGIERIEPGVVRKDVERRLYVLRKEQIRNTALRYRFQMVLQKYNTYQTHWLRICREIENGTYKRHLARAQRRFNSSRPPRRRSTAPPAIHPEPGAPVPKDIADELAELDRDFGPDSFDVDVQLDDVGQPSSRPLPPRPASSSSRPPPRPSPRPPAGAAPASGPLRPVAASAGSPVWKKVAAPGAPVAPAAAPAAAAPARAAAPAPAAPAPAAPRPAPPPGAPPLPIPRAVPPAAPGAPAVPVAPRPPAPVAPRAAPPAAPTAPQPAPRAAPPATPSPLPPRPPPPRPSLPNIAPPRPAPDSADLSEKRMRQIYVEYVDAKRRQNESTAAITYQAVAKTLRESGDRLREKHGKSVDFEVTVKDGKAVFRPFLKG